MNSRLPLLGFVLVTSLALVTGCRVSQSGRNAAGSLPEADSVLTRRAEAHAHYAQGVLLEINGRKNESIEEYHRAAQLDLANEELITQVARSWLVQKKPERAIEILKLGAEQPGATAMMDVLLGTAYAQAGKTDLAIQANRRAIQKSPQLLAGYQNLFAGYLQTGETDAALKVLDKAAGLRNPPADYLIGLAELYASVAITAPSEKTNVFSMALVLLDRAALLNPTNIQERVRLADGLNLVGESARAATMYQAILADYPQAPMLQENLRAKLTDIYLRGQDRKRALEQLEVLLKNDSLNVQAHYYAALLYTEADEPAKAEEHLRTVVVLNPKFEQAYYDLAMAQLRTDKTNEIITTLQAAQKKFGQNFISEFLFGLAEARREEWGDAVKYFTSAEIIARASDVKRLTPAFYHQFGAALERKGDYSEAVNCLQKALELDPDFPEAANHLGYMWAERGENLERAYELIAVAVKAEPKNEAYLDSMAWVLFKLGKPREALPFMQQAIELAEAAKQPDPTLYDHLGDIQDALGNTSEARKAWSAAVKIKPDPEIEKKLSAEAGN